MGKKIKIVHACLAGSYNDDWGYQDNLIPRYNKKAGYDVTVITSTFVDDVKTGKYSTVSQGEYVLGDGVKVIRLPFSKYIPNKLNSKLRIYSRLYKTLEKEKPDIIFIHCLQFLDLLTIKKYKKKNPNCRLIADNHATFENSAKNFLSRYILHGIFYKFVIKNTIESIEIIYAIAPASKQFLLRMYKVSPAKIEYLYLGADTDAIEKINRIQNKLDIRRLLNIQETDFVLITGGKLNEGKNTKVLIQEFKEIKDENLKLIIFGRFTEDIKEEMELLIESEPRIVFIGWISSDEVYKYYLAADVAVFPGTKSALWEQAICAGLPLICKKWNGMEYVDVGGNCIFTDDASLGKDIVELKADKSRYSSMQKIALSKGLETFSYEKISNLAIQNQVKKIKEYENDLEAKQ